MGRRVTDILSLLVALNGETKERERERERRWNWRGQD